ncbi:MAG: glutamine synthetase beta-grasp domain-containing protein [Pseudomonadota bacterium]|uniref:glutamine synthetase n=1 Tax=marine metagenome TaxID=408172 RepID=A0A381R4J2_9ZZZZ|nr:glutamine synthetase beta-grasp domain-containing protein [Pseudomonadota bacterium]MEC8867516.1 glutamine synthetase beta-grasp domain-containing protein [Pseudomonadota bacterium]MEC9286014.1 glutamine synthetase beta-grasp domain-containing protein [Pseudomonadota bacterium]HCP48637.1 glutamine synthetase [Gammaproteobacteria bacterium]|tara:strand:- start:3592 stop:4602 length:1011 start_codon:yes stop_codon:yes gene_type:complete
MKTKLEYIWLDGYKPTQSLRSKTLVETDFGGTLDDCPMWAFDGSSTEQAAGNDSDCLLKPVCIFPDPDRKNAYLVMTEVLNADGSPHVSNGRATIDDDDADFWFGYEQEYFLWDTDTDLPPGFPLNGYPGPQGPYYCSVGASNTYGRDCVDEHLDLCLDAGINVEGINAEVAAGQWEFQVFGKGAKRAGDETWLARYILERTGEKYGYAINWHPKPFGAMDWNGSGMHANFSNGVMRESGEEEVFTKICEHFGKNIPRHIEVYGAHNEIRLTGEHETESIDTFSFGIADRGASIRIPVATIDGGWKGRLEDRRTASNADPYKVAAAIIKTTKEALE